MTRLVSKISEITHIEFGRGKFDDWCVFVCEKGKRKYAPKDTEYFGRLQQLGKIHGAQQIFNDFLKIYERTTIEVNPQVIELIELISNAYGSDSFEVKKWLTVIYAGMIAEENKSKAILKKRIKRLGMYQTLIEQMPAEKAAIFSKGRKWQELDQICRELGF